MSWTILLLRDKIKVEMPFSTTVDFLKRRSMGGARFKNIKAMDDEARAFYSYRDTFFDRLGFLGAFENELRITTDPSNNAVTIIQFSVPAPRMIASAVAGIFLLCFLILAFPNSSLLWPSIILFMLYVGLVVGVKSQFHYFKSDIEQVQEEFRKTADKNELRKYQ